MARDLRCTGNNRQAYIGLSVAVQTYRMPRRPRNYLPGYTYHLVQRGVNRAPTFFQKRGLTQLPNALGILFPEVQLKRSCILSYD